VAVEINGIAHIQISVNDFARGGPFWERLCNFLGMSTLIKAPDTIYCIGGRTGLLVRPTAAEHRGSRFDQWRSGLHHFCFRARSREDVDAVYAFAKDELGAKIVHAPEEGAFAPGYYSVLFEDPDGIRVELNFVPGKGHFGGEGRLAPGGPGPAGNYGSGGLGRG
jgi:catechol 2,3-dioxygenase-like lactoylglutathione lyase family enzyme